MYIFGKQAGTIHARPPSLWRESRLPKINTGEIADAVLHTFNDFVAKEIFIVNLIDSREEVFSHTYKTESKEPKA
jgi:hypothetical protein